MRLPLRRTIMTERLDRQIDFLLESDRLKHVDRRSILADGSRRENSAEHSWHLALAAMVLAEYADTPVDLARVIPMLLIHDLVEIDAGDTFLYDEQGAATQSERESAAADRIFGRLPLDQAQAMRALWDEFAAKESADARFAGALDRLLPLLHHRANRGLVWREHGVSADRVFRRNRVIHDASGVLWDYARRLIDRAVEDGHLPGSD